MVLAGRGRRERWADPAVGREGNGLNPLKERKGPAKDAEKDLKEGTLFETIWPRTQLNKDFGHGVGAESNKPDDPSTPFNEGMNALRDLFQEDLGTFSLRSVIEDQKRAGGARALEPGCPYQKALNAAFFAKIDDMVRESDPRLDRESDRNGNVFSLNLP